MYRAFAWLIFNNFLFSGAAIVFLLCANFMAFVTVDSTIVSPGKMSVGRGVRLG